MSVNARRHHSTRVKPSKRQTEPGETIDQDVLDVFIYQVCVTVARTLQALAFTDYVEAKRDDLGLSIRSYYNYASIIKIDVVRQDKVPIYSRLEALPFFQSFKENGKVSA